MLLRTVFSFWAFLVPLVAVPLAAWGQADWPQFRGEAGDGQTTVSLPLSWDQETNIKWKAAIAGQGWSSPSVYSGTLYLTAAVAEGEGQKVDYNLELLGVSAKSGEIRFRTNLFTQRGASAPSIHSKNSHASPTPLISGGRVYVHFGHMGTACLDLDGKVIWKNDELKYRPVHGNGGSPVLVDDHLIFSCDGAADPFIVALNRETGKVVWNYKRESDAKKKFSFTTPAVVEVDGQKQVISPGSNVVCGLDPKTGEEIWRVRYDGYSVIPKPVFGDGMIFICTGYDRPTLMAIRLGGKGDVTDTHVEWVEEKAVPHTPSLLLIDGALYMVSDSGIASCLKAKTGEVVWRERVGGAYSASPIASNGRIYLQSEAGETHVLQVGAEYKVLSSHSLGERTLASYGVGDGAVFVRTADHLYRIEGK